MLDESMDVTSLNQFITYIRFYYYNQILTHFLDIRELIPQGQTAENLKATFKSVFEEENLDLNYCVGIYTDGSASMVGKGAGMVSKIKQQNPGIQTFQCVAHRWQLAAEDTSEHKELNQKYKNGLYTFIIVAFYFNVSEECCHIGVNIHNL
ncbi:MAG: hypothetical protein EZS28_005682 [Streblomastix strix]|uniref:DUF4371 domain-containing protein n=1 Tax=Streblomastix strix TaxID=222440 RepID=A0A5J4WWU5_9EUKA|nr:MAG: hypothetical protein EZS28_005682 [Streblomastix strix]